METLYQRRFASFSHWGMFDVTDFPWCMPLSATVTYGVSILPLSQDYDGTE